MLIDSRDCGRVRVRHCHRRAGAARELATDVTGVLGR